MPFPEQRVVYGPDTDILSGDFGTVTVPATITPADLLAVLTSVVFGGPQGPPPVRTLGALGKEPRNEKNPLN